MEECYNQSQEILILSYQLGYRIDKDGVLRNPKGKIVNGRLVAGYKTFGIRNSKGDVRNVRFHRLQAYQKFGDNIFEPGIVVRHLNNNKEDNSWDNIDIGTDKDNYQDSVECFRELRKEIGKKNRIYEYEDIINLRNSGMSYQKIADIYKTSRSQIYYICNRKIYFNHGKKINHE